jgi:hypothetical protein
MKLPPQELSLIASDSNLFLRSGQAIKEADFCNLQTSMATTVDLCPYNYWKRSKFNISEEKRGLGDVIVPGVRGESGGDPAPALCTPSPLPSASLSKPIAKPAPNSAQPGHPAFLSDAEFASLPHYEDIEDDVTYNTYYTRLGDSFVSIASLSSYIIPAQVNESWVQQVKLGFDIGGELHFFKQGAKRKKLYGAVDGVNMKAKSHGQHDVAECEVKKRDCRIREKRVRGRFGMAMCTDELDAEWEEAYENGYVFNARDENISLVGEVNSGNDNAVLLGILGSLGIAPQDVDGCESVDDGFGGYGREIF